MRALTANFLRAHFDDSSWFQFGSYAVFDRQAQDVLDGKESFFGIPDSSRTDLIQYPPGYRVWMAAIYAATGDRSAVSVQRVQLVLDSLSVLLIVGIGATAYRWRVGIAAGTLAALSPLLAFYGATPGADAPTSWLVLGAVWLFILSAKRKSIYLALSAGALLGVACWVRVNPLLLFLAWAVALLLFLDANWRRRLALSAAVTFSTLLVISPVVVRNLVVFYPEVAPTGLNIGWNLWAGIGETERGAEFGAPCCDAQMIEQDRKEMGLPPNAPLGLNWPDGIRRDRERARKALAVIRAHPFWYSGVMARRVWGNLKFAGKPAPNVGSAGFNVTSRKCLPTRAQGGALAVIVNLLGMAQSVLRYLALPLMLAGLYLALRRDYRVTGILMTTVLYYLATLSIAHSEIRYGLPMQALLLVFAGVAICALIDAVGRTWMARRSHQRQLMSETIQTSDRHEQKRCRRITIPRFTK